MSFLTALYDSYNYGLENNLVGDLDNKSSLILPIYHNSMKSNGKNIVEILVNKKSELVDAHFLNENEIVIFPVTEDSVARSSGVAPHPLFDNFDYVIQEDTKKSNAYIEQQEFWLNSCEDDFVKIIHDFIIKEKVFEEILGKLFKEYKILKDKNVEFIDNSDKKSKKMNIDFSKVFLTFKIQNYDEKKDLSLSDNKNLQQKFIEYTRKTFERDKDSEKIICNISGKEDFLCLKHKPLIGSARLISQITANNENYLGRFEKPDNTIKIGKESSQKIIQMAKSLLDGEKTSRWLGEFTYALSWFSDDIQNKSGLDPGKSVEIENVGGVLSLLGKKDGIKSSGILKKEKISDENSENIVKSFTSGKILFSNESKYYMAIVDKVSNGRVAVKYFREMDSSRLKENLVSWQNKYNWIKHTKDSEIKNYTPSPLMLILAAYGVEREKGLEVSKKKFVTDQYKNILASIIEGRDMPKNISYALEMNIRNRLNYDKSWAQVKLCALAVLKEKEGITSDMLDRKDTDRSYLFGRLLALYERLEKITYDTDNERVTNAEKLWTSYVNKPVTMNLRLRNLLRPYEDKLIVNESKRGIYFKIKRDIREVSNLLSENYDYKLKENNRPLGPGFIFGYEAQMKDLFTKREDKKDLESEEKHD